MKTLTGLALCLAVSTPAAAQWQPAMEPVGKMKCVNIDFDRHDTQVPNQLCTVVLRNVVDGCFYLGVVDRNVNPPRFTSVTPQMKSDGTAACAPNTPF